MKSRLKDARRFIEKHQNIVDLGCGKGEYYAGLDLSNKNIMAIDSNGYFLRHFWKFPTIKTLAKDARDTGLPEKSFDLVILSQVIEHLENYEPLLAEAKRLCKDNGYFYVGLPISSEKHGHFHPIWSEEKVRELSEKLGAIIEFNNLKWNWSVYIKNE